MSESEFSKLTARLRPRKREGWGSRPDEFDGSAVADAWERLHKVFAADRLYPVEYRGAEGIPDPPVLVVANHSGGVLVPDAWGLGYAWYAHFRFGRPLHALVHEVPMRIKRTGASLARLGGVAADREVGHRILTEWNRDLLVMPGGDLDVYRPYRDRYKVQFGGRRGYARLALRAGVRIVPVANSGAHATMVVLTDGQRVARMLRLRRYFRANIFPVSLSVPWGLTVGPWPNVPIPTRLRYRWGGPVTLPGTFKRRFKENGEPTDEAVDLLDQLVRDAMSALLASLEDETPGLRQRLRRGLRS